jgi:hypothetical protein
MPLLRGKHLANAFLEHLERFNRKERFFLLACALQNAQKFALHQAFLERLSQAVGVAFAAMDYHLDWIYASAFLSHAPEDEGIRVKDGIIYARDEICIAATQEDVDLLVAFADKDAPERDASGSYRS